MSGTVVNGGTGDYGLEAAAVALVFVAGPPLLAWLTGRLSLMAARRRRYLARVQR